MKTGIKLKLKNGEYTVGDLIGKGGIGEVYIAQNPKNKEMIAIKFVPDYMKGKRQIKALKKEFEIIKRLSKEKHSKGWDHIIEIYDFSGINNEHFLVLPYMEGKNLYQREREEILSDEEKLRITHEIASGLAYLHYYNIIHGDIKPQNVLFDKEGKVKITDFNLSFTPSFFRRKPGKGGTPSYMSPNQLTGRSLSKKDDVYAFGITIYELFSGTLPFTHFSTIPGLQRLPSDEKKRLIKELYIERKTVKIKNIPHMPPKYSYLEEIITKCLQFNERDREQDMVYVDFRIAEAKPSHL